MRKLLLGLCLSILAPAVSLAGDIVISQFGGLNTEDTPAALAPHESQDLLNVGITPGGRSVFKREGYGLYKTLTYSTSAVHGAHYFQDTSGSDIQLWGNDRYLNGTVNGGTPVLLATGTLAATWQCADSVGFAYCLTSSRDTAVRTSGTSATTTRQGGIPLGTMVTSTPDRLVVSGVSANESTLYFSKANTFTNFVVGINSADSFTEVIESPGSRITHVRYACGKVLWWKDASFGFTLGADQFNLENVIISPNIGSLDNSSDEYNGHVYFRGQDNHIYDYDCANVTRLSRAITPTVASANRRKSNAWTQTTQSDFAAGAVSFNGPTITLSTAIVSGSIVPSSITVTDTSSTDFGQFTSISTGIDTSTVAGAITLKSYLADSFSSFSNWTADTNAFFPQTMTASGGTTSCSGGCMAYSDRTVSGDFLLGFDVTAAAADGATTRIAVVDSSEDGYMIRLPGYGSGSTMRIGRTTDFTNPNTLTTICSSGTMTSGAHTYLLSRESSSQTLSLYKDGVLVCSAIDSTFSSFTRVRISVQDGTSLIDNVYDAVRVGNFNSRVFDMAFSTPVYGTFTANTSGTGTFAYATKSSQFGASGFGADSVITSGSQILSTPKRYVIYSATITATTSASSLPQVTDVAALASSTGTYYSAVNNAPSLTSWGPLTITDSVVGLSTITYYSRSSLNPFTVLSGTPTWVSQPKNATVAPSTGTYFQLKAEFSITSATENPSVSDFTFNWFEGTSADKSYIKYWHDYLWVSVSSGTAGLNNRIQRWDLQNQTWLLDDIAANGFLVDNDALYFGDPSAGKIYRYGGVDTDNSGAINAYWKSKDFTGDDPFLQNTYNQADFIVKSASGTVMTVTYTLDASSSTSYSLNLYDGTRSIIRKGTNLPNGKIGTFFNVQFGDNSSSPRWEVLGYRARYVPLPWRPN